MADWGLQRPFDVFFKFPKKKMIGNKLYKLVFCNLLQRTQNEKNTHFCLSPSQTDKRILILFCNLIKYMGLRECMYRCCFQSILTIYIPCPVNCIYIRYLAQTPMFANLSSTWFINICVFSRGFLVASVWCVRSKLTPWIRPQPALKVENNMANDALARNTLYTNTYTTSHMYIIYPTSVGGSPRSCQRDV